MAESTIPGTSGARISPASSFMTDMTRAVGPPQGIRFMIQFCKMMRVAR